LPFIPFAQENEFTGDDEAAAEPLAPASKGPKSIDGALPGAPTFTPARKAACANKQCELKAWLPDPAFAKSVPAGEPSPAALWAQEIAGGSTLILPRHHALEVLAVVLDGGVLAQGDDGGARKLAVWDALRVPGAGVSLKADKSGAKLVLAVASNKGTLAEALDHAKAKPWEVRWKKRPSAIASTSLKDAKDLVWGKGAYHARIAFGGEYPTPASLETLLAGPDAAIAEHDHPTWEHIAILEGAGVMKLAGADHPVSPGAIFHIPKGVRHAFAPSGSSRLLAVQLYTPSGPEQRFIKLSADDAKPPAQPAAK
jgi:mannose-6-phosphate isomerase-like protein (cupin superfamily)